MIASRTAVPARNWIRRGLPLRTHGRGPTSVTASQPAMEPVAPCQPAMAVRSLGAHVSVPAGITTGVGDGTGVGVASTQGTIEPDGRCDGSALIDARDADGAGSVFTTPLPQPATATAASTATRDGSSVRGTGSLIVDTGRSTGPAGCIARNQRAGSGWDDSRPLPGDPRGGSSPCRL